MDLATAVGAVSSWRFSSVNDIKSRVYFLGQPRKLELCLENDCESTSNMHKNRETLINRERGTCSKKRLDQNNQRFGIPSPLEGVQKYLAEG